MSKTNLFDRLLRRSPISKLQEHMRVVCKCVNEVLPLFEASFAGDRVAVQAHRDVIDRCESEADFIKNELRMHLPKGLFLSVGRNDVLQVVQTQDSIADVAQDIADLMVARDMCLPEFMQAPVLELVARCVEACDQSALIIEELDELQAVGFQGQKASVVEDMVVELGRIESETDAMGVSLERTLFEHEEQLGPVSVLLWHQQLRSIGNIADYAENVGDRVRLLVAR